MDTTESDRNEELASTETPEDVAILYSWANLHGAKYRDFSASRREYRAQMRHRAAEQQREEELRAAAEAEAAAAAAEQAARDAEEAARRLEQQEAFQAEEAERLRMQTLQAAEDATRKASAERVEAARRAEAAAAAEAVARRAEREMAEAHASAERQAARYADSDFRRRQAAGPQPRAWVPDTSSRFVPGQLDDPYSPAQQSKLNDEYFVRPGQDVDATPYRGRDLRGPSSAQRSIARSSYESPASSSSSIREVYRNQPMNDRLDRSTYDDPRNYQEQQWRQADASRGAPAARPSDQREDDRQTQYRDPAAELRTPVLDPSPPRPHREQFRELIREQVREQSRDRVPDQPASRLVQRGFERTPDRSYDSPADRNDDRARDNAEMSRSYFAEQDRTPASANNRSPYSTLPPEDLRPVHEQPELRVAKPRPWSDEEFAKRQREREMSRSGERPVAPAPNAQEAGMDSPRRQYQRRTDFRVDASSIRPDAQRREREQQRPLGLQDRVLQDRPLNDRANPSQHQASASAESAQSSAPVIPLGPAWLYASNDRAPERTADRNPDRDRVEEPVGELSARDQSTHRPERETMPELQPWYAAPSTPAAPSNTQGETRPNTRSQPAPQVEARSESPRLDSSRMQLSRLDAGRAAKPETRPESRPEVRQELRRELRPEEQIRTAPRSGRTASSDESPVIDTLQHSRERVASRWFALKGVFDQGIVDTPENQTVRQTEIRTPILTVFSLAGGVGKTCLVATLGRALSSMGEKVLLTDTTSHGLLPFYFGASELRTGVVRTFSPPPGSTDAPIYLVSYDVESRHELAAQTQLAEEIMRASRGTQRVLLDLTASTGWLIRRLAPLSPTVLVPVAPDMNSIISLQAVEKYFQDVVDGAGRPIKPYFVLNQFDAALPLHLDVREVLRQQLGERLLPFVIRRSPAVSEALAEGMTVVDYAPESPAAVDYLGAATWLRSLTAPAPAGFRNVRWSER